MVYFPISLGGMIGVVLSAAFVYWEVGRFAAPQVPRSLFDEKRELLAYTAGLFVGIPLTLPFLFFLAALSNSALLGALLLLVFLVAGTELAQWVLLRTKYFGQGASAPFYALGFRAGIAGILVLALVAQYLVGPSITFAGVGLVLLQSVALILLQGAGALLSLRIPQPSHGSRGGPWSGAILTSVGFFLIGFGSLYDPLIGAVGAGIAIVGAVFVYGRFRTILAKVPPPEGLRGRPKDDQVSRFGRTDRGGRP